MRKRLRDLTGERFGKLVALGRVPGPKAPWFVRCDCGVEKTVPASKLASGHTQSCGCGSAHHRRGPAHHQYRHGLSGTSVETIWSSMRARCENPRVAKFADYGGRGIKVCERWASLEAFAADMGPKPSAAHTLERINNDGNYEPGNCCWATRKEQARNRRSSRLLTFDGRTMCMAAWAEETKIRAGLITARIDRLGWPIDLALTVRPRAKAAA